MIMKIEVRGQAALERKLKALDKALDTREILDESGAVLFNRIRKRFLDQTDPDGNNWVPSKAARRRGGKTLYDTGRLFRSLQLYAVGENSRAIGTNVPYAPIHNFGVGGMVRRTFLGFGEEDVTVVEALILKRISEAIK